MLLVIYKIYVRREKLNNLKQKTYAKEAVKCTVSILLSGVLASTARLRLFPTSKAFAFTTNVLYSWWDVSICGQNTLQNACDKLASFQTSSFRVTWFLGYFLLSVTRTNLLLLRTGIFGSEWQLTYYSLNRIIRRMTFSLWCYVCYKLIYQTKMWK